MSDSGSEYSGGEEEDEEEQSESESDEVPETKRRRRRANRTSFTCHHCKIQFPKYVVLKEHMKNCKQRNWLNKCMWCGLEFANRGNLATHAYHLHGDSSYKSLSRYSSTSVNCNVCNKSCASMASLRYHIRKTHFNLKAKIPHAEAKKVNQIWFEKVLNTDKIVEIKKTSHSTLILKSLKTTSGVRVNDIQQKEIDLTPLYPVGKASIKVICDYCDKPYVKRDLHKHIEETHLNLKKFSCNNCQRSFKRSYQYLQHQCGKIRRTKGVRHVVGRHATPFKISRVEGFAVPL